MKRRLFYTRTCVCVRVCLCIFPRYGFQLKCHNVCSIRFQKFHECKPKQRFRATRFIVWGVFRGTKLGVMMLFTHVEVEMEMFTRSFAWDILRSLLRKLNTAASCSRSIHCETQIIRGFVAHASYHEKICRWTRLKSREYRSLNTRYKTSKIKQIVEYITNGMIKVKTHLSIHGYFLAKIILFRSQYCVRCESNDDLN